MWAESARHGWRWTSPRDCANAFPDGVLVIELAAVGDPAAVPDAVAAVLGITQQPGLSLADSVADALDGRSRLLVFDNCEHVLDSAADHDREDPDSIGDRENSGHQSRRTAGGRRTTLVRCRLWTSNRAAATLFVERARAVAPEISRVNIDHARAVVEICRRLDGIPLAYRVGRVTPAVDDGYRSARSARTTGSGSSSAHGADSSATRLCATPCSGRTTCSTMPKRRCWQRCSVFAGGFDLQGARAVGGAVDEFAGHGSSRCPRAQVAVGRRPIRRIEHDSRCWRPSANSPRNNSCKPVRLTRPAARMPATSRGGKPTCWRCGTVRASARPTYGFPSSWRTCAPRSAGLADHGDMDTAAAIAFYAGLLGVLAEQYEPVSWAEELIEPAKAAQHRRLAQLYLIASQCLAAGRPDDAVRFADNGLAVIFGGRFDEVPFDFESAIVAPYTMVGRPQDAVDPLPQHDRAVPRHSYPSARLPGSGVE